MNLVKPIKHWHLIAWERDIKDLKTIRLYDEKYFIFDKKLALDRCPHRGASLSKGSIIDKSVKCNYHNRYFSCVSHPDMFGGVIKDGALWYGGDDELIIPRIEEFDDDSYRSLFMSRRLKNINPMALAESNIDSEHVSAVHSIKIDRILTPVITMRPSALLNIHEYDAPKFRLKIETMFWLPFSNCLKFYLFDKRKNKIHEPFILWFSITPHANNDVTLHIRSLRKKIQGDIDILLDPIFTAISDIPIREDYHVVKNVDMSRIHDDNLTSEDDFIKFYRSMMLENCPGIYNYMIT